MENNTALQCTGTLLCASGHKYTKQSNTSVSKSVVKLPAISSTLN